MRLLTFVGPITSFIARTGLVIAGVALMFTAVGGTASAVDLTPEIDPGTISSAVTLLVGTTMLLAGRRFRR